MGLPQGWLGLELKHLAHPPAAYSLTRHGTSPWVNYRRS